MLLSNRVAPLSSKDRPRNQSTVRRLPTRDELGAMMNTAVARRLASGDRVVWIGGDGDQPAGPGTITRISAHAVEVRWDCGRATRYRRAHLHNLRHVKVISETGECEHSTPDSPRGSLHFPDLAAIPSAHRAVWP